MLALFVAISAATQIRGYRSDFGLAFASVAIAFAARSCEIINFLDWADIVKLKDIVKEEYEA